MASTFASDNDEKKNTLAEKDKEGKPGFTALRCGMSSDQSCIE